MKTKASLALVAIFTASLAASMGQALASQVDDPSPSLVRVNAQLTYIPYGFDSNDRVQLVMAGVFKNTCLRSAPSVVKIDEVEKVIFVRAQAYQYKGPCADVTVDWDQVVDVGVLNPGHYLVLEEGLDFPTGGVEVHGATTSNADDYLYAPVSQAYVKKSRGRSRLYLSGVFRNSCLRVENVIVGTRNQVITVQPVSVFDQERPCIEGRFPFEKSVELPRAAPGRYLLHVRTLNGKAINNLIELE